MKTLDKTTNKQAEGMTRMAGMYSLSWNFWIILVSARLCGFVLGSFSCFNVEVAYSKVKCQFSLERRVLDLVSEVLKGTGSIPTGSNILSLDFFHVVKPLMPILPLLPILSICKKLAYIPYTGRARLIRTRLIRSST